jgi:hypothetical protein
MNITGQIILQSQQTSTVSKLILITPVNSQWQSIQLNVLKYHQAYTEAIQTVPMETPVR